MNPTLYQLANQCKGAIAKYCSKRPETKPPSPKRINALVQYWNDVRDGKRQHKVNLKHPELAGLKGKAYWSAWHRLKKEKEQ